MAGRAAGLLVLLFLPFGGPSLALTLARDGRAEVTIRLATGASPAETTAAHELRHYLEVVTGARFDLSDEEGAGGAERAIHVGPTALARGQGPDPDALGPEEWIIKGSGRQLLLYGGRPRGTLYAVYRFLEDEIGVRWWAPGEETVPSRPTLKVAVRDRRGEPAFSYRDIFGVYAAEEFRARSRLNGHYSGPGEAYGGAERYGPPRHGHTFFDYAPPGELFDRHPDYFSELAGVRYGGRSQLCLSNPDLADLLVERLSGYIERAGRGGAAPRLFSFSQNDWGNRCRCSRCRAAEERTGAASGPLLQLVNRLARDIYEKYPGRFVDTLAYMHTLAPPVGLRAGENVVIRLSALQYRDFSRPLSDPVHETIRDAVEGWRGVTRHLRIWDYGVTFGPNGDLPLPGTEILAADLRYYAGVGVEGVFVQHDYPVAADMRALELWVLLQLLDDPRRDVEVLETRFLRGYYGPAGRPLRRHLRALSRQVERQPARIGFTAPASDYHFLDGPFLLRAQERFDRAEAATGGDPVLLRRVRHARLSLDRATLWRWGLEFGGADEAADRRGRTLRRDAVAERYRETWFAEIERQYGPEMREAARAEVLRELDHLESLHRSSHAER